MGKKFMSVSEAIQLTTLSRATINRLIVLGEIPSYKIGKRRLFNSEELADWLQNHKSIQIKDIRKTLSKIEEVLLDEDKIKDLSHQEAMDLYTLLTHNMHQILKFQRSLQSCVPMVLESLKMLENLKHDIER